MEPELDISNDPEVEKLGANAAAMYAVEFWNKLAEAARKDGRLLDSFWDDVKSSGSEMEDITGEEIQEFGSSEKSAYHTRRLQLTDSKQQDWRLYQRFKSNFGNFPVAHIKSSAESNPLTSPKWTSLLLASEGVVPEYNFMTLLRNDCMLPFWMDENNVSDGILVVARAQFLFIELARCKEGWYDRSFRKVLQLFDIKTATDALQASLFDADKEHHASKALGQLLTQWQNPSISALKTTGVIRVLKKGAAEATTALLRKMCLETLQRWQDVWELGRLVNSKQQLPALSEKQKIALKRATKSLVARKHSETQRGRLIGTGENGEDGARTYQTKTTNETKDIIVTHTNDDQFPLDTQVAEIFNDYGIVILQDFISLELVEKCKIQAQDALTALSEEQLLPRGLQFDGEEEFDFAEVRQRPGHRLDNRYKILEVPDSPIVQLSKTLLTALPKKLFPKAGTAPRLKILYGGVVHSFPRKNEGDEAPPPQFWHRDGPSLFPDDHHVSHCFNVFIPLVDVTAYNGATEFVAGTHEDIRFDDVAGDIILKSQIKPHEKPASAIRGEVDTGSVIVFDIRVFHRGLSNQSMEERPMLYFTIARDWFEEQHMFQTKSIFSKSGKNEQQYSVLCKQLHKRVTGRLPDSMDLDYGHPHFTDRFDLLLLEQFLDDPQNLSSALANYSAVQAFCDLSIGDKESTCREFISCLGSESKARKTIALEQARSKRRAVVSDGEGDFTSISDDMSDVATLYNLTKDLVLVESSLLSKLGFVEDETGLLIAIATMKAFCSIDSNCTFGVSHAQVEDSFTSWWNAANDRFVYASGHATSDVERSKRSLIVAFSSLGSGIARPEWTSSLEPFNKSQSVDVLHVIDFGFSWYCQDPTCEWKGNEFYEKELKTHCARYKTTVFIGDSMGGAAALRFSSLANYVLAFTPQIDIMTYEAITRKDFLPSIRAKFKTELLEVVRTSAVAKIVIHYGEKCPEDARQLSFLPKMDHIDIVGHDYDDHVLSLHLRDQGVLGEIVQSTISGFLGQ